MLLETRIKRLAVSTANINKPLPERIGFSPELSSDWRQFLDDLLQMISYKKMIPGHFQSIRGPTRDQAESAHGSARESEACLQGIRSLLRQGKAHTGTYVCELRE